MHSSMASFLIFSLLLTFSTTTLSLLSPSPSPSPSPFSLLPQPPPTHPQDSPQQQQFNSIIDSIVGAGDFSNWANLLSQADPSTFPLAATFFIPDDDAFLAGNSPPSPESGNDPVNFIDPLLFPYHIIPRQFSFAELRLFPSGARLPTLLPGKTLLITNNSAGNFSINSASLSHPDLFKSAVVSVHGIASVLQYNLFGSDNSSSPENSPDISPSPEIEFTELERGPVSEYAKSDGNFVSERVLLTMYVLVFLEIVEGFFVILFVDAIFRMVFYLSGN